MTFEEIKRITQNGEGQFLEFKKKANHPDKVMKEVVAFANAKGGKLLIGVDDDGTASGTRSIEGEAFIIEKAITELTRPKVNYELEIVKINDKKGIAIFKIPESRKKPHFVKDNPNTRFGTAFVRRDDESLQASKEMREILKRSSNTRNERFEYGEKEKALMELIQNEGFATLNSFSTYARIKKFFASKTLVKLVLANVLDIEPAADGDKYFLKETDI